MKRDDTMDITQEKLNQLITCHKTIVTPPKKQMFEKSCSLRNNFTAQSTELDENFSVFLRQNAILSEDYSIGLIWLSKNDGNIIIFRCNGPHGGNISIKEHFVTHTHMLNVTDAINDIFHENITQPTTQYTTFEDAIQYFCTYCGIEDASNYFSFMRSISLF